MKIKSAEETELNGQGPDIDDEAVNKLLQSLISFRTEIRLYSQEAYLPRCLQISMRRYSKGSHTRISEQ